MIDPLSINRRHFFKKSTSTIGGMALASMLAKNDALGLAPEIQGFPNFAAKAKRVIYLFQSGGPSQLELFDDKPLLRDLNGQELPAHSSLLAITDSLVHRSASCSPIIVRSPMTCASYAMSTPMRSIMTRQSRFFKQARRSLVDLP